MTKTFSARELYKSYRRPVVRGISLQLEMGQVVGLLGPNGAGKTTSFYMLTGLEAPDSGEIFIDGVNVTHLSLEMRTRHGLAYLPQEASVFTRLSVRENLLSPLQIRGGISARQMRERTDELLREFGLESLAESRGAQLSGGERRRTEIARAVATRPDFLLLDEPFAGIDPIAANRLIDTITELRTQGIGVLITDHNAHEMVSICDYMYVVSEGKIIAAGRPIEIIKDPEARKVFFGEDFPT
ncbi:MAG: LPS export ABC transporter ATP-binding protein [Gammaproteobacteria bacterium AqS3]|nr:LPS export ABC transporter ATP-binding protein [Gammaproteobacteria bacterium AqS3]